MKRSIGLSLATVIFLQHGVFAHSLESNVWMERRGGFLNNTLASPASSASSKLSGLNEKNKISDLTSLLSNLPSAIGTVQKNVSAESSGPLIVHIQDVHMNLEAQQNIARIIEYFVKEGGFKLVGLEGAFGGIDMTGFESIDENVRKVSANRFLSRLEIGGPIFYALLHPSRDVAMTGVDDRPLFKKNWAAVRDVQSMAFALRRIVDGRNALIELEKKKTFNKELNIFDESVQRYRAGLLPVKDYVGVLQSHAGSIEPNLAVYSKALELESSINIPLVEKERDRFVQDLVFDLTAQERASLMESLASLRDGRSGQSEFFNGLFASARKKGKQIPDSLIRYAAYLHLSQKINPEALLDEIRLSEQIAYRLLAKTSPERELVAKSERLHLSKKLIEFSLTPQEWNSHKTSAVGEGEIGRFNKPFESFYETARERDQAIAQNLAAALKEKKASRAILVAGGFHSEGIHAALRQKGIQVVTVSPKFNVVDAIAGSDSLFKIASRKDVLADLFANGNTFLTQPTMTPRLRSDMGLHMLGLWLKEDPSAGDRVFRVSDGILSPAYQRLLFAFNALGGTFLMAGSPQGVVLVQGDGEEENFNQRKTEVANSSAGGYSNFLALLFFTFFRPSKPIERILFGVFLLVEIFFLRWLILSYGPPVALTSVSLQFYGLLAGSFVLAHAAVGALQIIKGRPTKFSQIGSDALWNLGVVLLYILGAYAAPFLNYSAGAGVALAMMGHVGLDLARVSWQTSSNAFSAYWTDIKAYTVWLFTFGRSFIGRILTRDPQSRGFGNINFSRSFIFFTAAVIVLLLIVPNLSAATGVIANVGPLFAQSPAANGLMETLQAIFVTGPGVSITTNSIITEKLIVAVSLMTMVNAFLILFAHWMTSKYGQFELAYPLCLMMGTLGVSGMMMAMQGAFILGLTVIGILGVFRNRYGERSRKDFTFLMLAYISAFMTGNGMFWGALVWTLMINVAALIFAILPIKRAKQFELSLIFKYAIIPLGPADPAAAPDAESGETTNTLKIITGVLNRQARKGYTYTPNITDSVGVMTVDLDLNDARRKNDLIQSLYAIGDDLMITIQLTDRNGTPDPDVAPPMANAASLLFPISFASLLAFGAGTATAGEAAVAAGAAPAAPAVAPVFAQTANWTILANPIFWIAIAAVGALLWVIFVKMRAHYTKLAESRIQVTKVGEGPDDPLRQSLSGSMKELTHEQREALVNMVVPVPASTRIKEFFQVILIPVFMILALAVSYILIQGGTARAEVSYTAYAKPVGVSNLVPSSSGKVTRVFVNNTRFVRKDQPIYEYEPADPQLIKTKVEALYAALDAAKADVQKDINAEIDRANREKLAYLEAELRVLAQETNEASLNVPTESARALLARAKGYAQRARQLYLGGALAKEEYERAQGLAEDLDARLKAGSKGVANSKTGVSRIRGEMKGLKPTATEEKRLAPFRDKVKALERKAALDAKALEIELGPKLVTAPFDGEIEGEMPVAGGYVIRDTTLLILTTSIRPDVGVALADPTLGIPKKGDIGLARERRSDAPWDPVEVLEVSEQMTTFDGMMKAHNLEISGQMRGANVRGTATNTLRNLEGVVVIFKIPPHLRMINRNQIEFKWIPPNRLTPLGHVKKALGMQIEEEPKAAPLAEKKIAEKGDVIGRFGGKDLRLGDAGQFDFGPRFKQISGGWREGKTYYLIDDETDLVGAITLDELKDGKLKDGKKTMDAAFDLTALPKDGKRGDGEGATRHPDGKRVLIVAENRQELWLVNPRSGTGNRRPNRSEAKVYKIPDSVTDPVNVKGRVQLEGICYVGNRLFMSHGSELQPRLSEIRLLDDKGSIEIISTMNIVETGVGVARDLDHVKIKGESYLIYVDSLNKKIHLVWVSDGNNHRLTKDVIDLSRLNLGDQIETVLYDELNGGILILSETQKDRRNWSFVPLELDEKKGAMLDRRMEELKGILPRGALPKFVASQTAWAADIRRREEKEKKARTRNAWKNGASRPQLGLHADWLPLFEKYPQYASTIAFFGGAAEGLIPLIMASTALFFWGPIGGIIAVVAWGFLNGYRKYANGYIAFEDGIPVIKKGTDGFGNWFFSNATSWLSLLFLIALNTSEPVSLGWLLFLATVPHGMADFLLSLSSDRLTRTLWQLRAGGPIVVPIRGNSTQDAFAADVEAYLKLIGTIRSNPALSHLEPYVIVNYYPTPSEEEKADPVPAVVRQVSPVALILTGAKTDYVDDVLALAAEELKSPAYSRPLYDDLRAKLGVLLPLCLLAWEENDPQALERIAAQRKDVRDRFALVTLDPSRYHFRSMALEALKLDAQMILGIIFSLETRLPISQRMRLMAAALIAA